MNKTEREIVATMEQWIKNLLRKARDEKVESPVAMLCQLMAYQDVADAIERGDHRQHSPATVKDSQ